jgi:hypothetical protein
MQKWDGVILMGGLGSIHNEGRGWSGNTCNEGSPCVSF